MKCHGARPRPLRGASALGSRALPRGSVLTHGALLPISVQHSLQHELGSSRPRGAGRRLPARPPETRPRSRPKPPATARAAPACPRGPAARVPSRMDAELELAACAGLFCSRLRDPSRVSKKKTRDSPDNFTPRTARERSLARSKSWKRACGLARFYQLHCRPGPLLQVSSL